MRGYQVVIADATKMGLWHHSLSPEKYRSHLATAGQFVRTGKDSKKKTTQRAAPTKVQSVCRNDEWNELVGIAKGPRLVQKINHVVLPNWLTRRPSTRPTPVCWRCRTTTKALLRCSRTFE